MARPNSPLPPPGQLTTGLFRTRKNYARWRERGAPGWLLVYTLDGMGRFGYPGGELLAGRGNLVLLAPGALHDYGIEASRRQWDLLWAYFFPGAHWQPLLNWPETAPGLHGLHLSNPGVRRQIVALLHQTHQSNSGSHRLREMLALNSLEKALLLCDAINPRSAEAQIDSRVRRAMDDLCADLGRPITLDRLARRCGLSASRLAHIFRAQVGQTPRQFLERHRMTRARQLLTLTDQPVGSIAIEVGFPDLFHFSKRFRRHFGLSPRHYRRREAEASGRA